MTNSMRRATAMLLCAGLALPGCATARAGGVTIAPARVQPGVESHVLAEYVQRLPPGSDLRIGRRTGGTLRGTLVKATALSVVVQPRTRVPVPPIEIPLTDVVSVIPETPGRTHVGKVIGLAAAAGAGAALGVLMLLAAIYAD